MREKYMPKKGETKANAKPASKAKRAYNRKTQDNRVKRNQARRVAEKEGRVKKGDGKEIDHKKPLRNGGSNAKSNQRVVSSKTNKAKNGSFKGMTRKGKRS
jgi:hypothetical protein|tara:strand:+ start:175 stop:477 length:303 start_codon:yes stop_codon:yes gene_type:complete